MKNFFTLLYSKALTAVKKNSYKINNQYSNKKAISIIPHLVYFFVLIVGTITAAQAQTGIGDNFNQNKLSCKWNPTANYAVTNTNAELKIVGSNAGSDYNNLSFDFSAINVSSNPVVTVKIKTNAAVTVRLDLKDVNEKLTNANPISKLVSNSGTYTTYTFDFTNKFNQSSPYNSTVDPTKIVQLVLFFNAGGSGYNGTVYLDDLQIGTGGSSDGGLSKCPLPINYAIRLNQIGFYPDLEKIAIVAGNPSAGSFYVKSLDLATTYFTGTLGATATWTFSNEKVRAADFTAFATPGDYVLDVPGVGYSPPFKIDQDVFNVLSKTVIKGFYLKRASTPITAQYAGTYARAAGHPDNAVKIHSSAASPGRPAGTVVSSPKGWYDAGDYGSYVVNSGITTFTLLSSYEHFKSYYDTLPLNIPESGNGTPDILNEIKWNLDWMLTMQDPYDGGVYHKKTTTDFNPFEMPDADQAQRYLIGKGTAATFDFAAVMAVAYRTYLPYNATFANTCLAASKRAYTWGIANPNTAFTNPGDISTGEYGDDVLSDEKEWAATELYISTKTDSYYANSYKAANIYAVPAWPLVNTLGLISLVHHRSNLTSVGFADTTAIKNSLFSIANKIRTHKITASAYKTGMGANGNDDFVWGSNSVALNESMICMASYLATEDISYINTAIAGLDYVLGRNATTYSFVSGLGSNPVMHPHDRISGSDGIVDPVPGWIAGGPNKAALNDCGSSAYPSNYIAASFVDSECSYSTNEIAINWNAPLVFVGVGLQKIIKSDLGTKLSVYKDASILLANNSPALSLGEALINNAISPSTVITIKNTGVADLLITSITTSTGFVLGPLSSPSPIIAGASSTFTITATPTKVGLNNGVVTIKTNDPSTSTFLLNISVTGNSIPKPILVVLKDASVLNSNSSTPLDLGTAIIGTAVNPPTSITIKNTGNALLTINSISTSAGFVLSALTPSSPIAAGATATFTITATPKNEGLNTGLITINSNDSLSVFKLNVSVSGTAVPRPVMDVAVGTTSYTDNNSIAVDLGTAVKGAAASPTTSITIKNTGNAVLSISSITPSAGFVLSTLAPSSSIAAGATATFTITATPINEGLNNGVITIKSNDAVSEFKLNVRVTGTVLPKPVMDVAVGTTSYTNNNSIVVDLGSAVKGIAVSPTTSITIMNTGNAVLTISSITPSSGFVLSTLAPSSSIAVGATATFTITATPINEGLNSGVITIISNDAVSIFKLNVRVTGTVLPKPVMGVAVGTTSYTNNNSIAVDLGSAVKGIAVSPTTSIIIKNTGNAVLSISSITPSTGFVLSALAPSSSIAAGATATFTITATPINEGLNSGVITINSNDAVSIFKLNVRVTGTLVPRPVMGVAVGTTSYTNNNSIAVDLGSAVKGTAVSPTTSVTIKNTGNAVLSISSITTSSGFVLSTLAPSSSIAVGETATFTITATPINEGLNSGVITINSNDAVSIFKLNVRVTGSSKFAEMSITQGANLYINAGNAYVFPETVKDVQVSSLLFTITNTGNITLNLGEPTIVGPYQLNGPLSYTVESGATTTFVVIFKPTTNEVFNGSIVFQANTLESYFMLNLSGAGVLATRTIGKLSNDAISIHPNPSSGQTSVQLDGAYTNVSIHVYNALGQKIISNEKGNLNNTTFSLSLGDNASGIYFLEIISEEGTCLKRLIKE